MIRNGLSLLGFTELEARAEVAARRRERDRMAEQARRLEDEVAVGAAGSLD